jgi:acyl-CoA dehydrogenase
LTSLASEAMDDARGEYDHEVLEGLGRFVDTVVVPLEEKHAAELDNPSTWYDGSGRPSDLVRTLKATVRTGSARAGYYPMFAPEDVGGGGFGPVLEFQAWEYLHRRYGPGRPLPYAVIAHWAMGPSFLCSKLSPEIKSAVSNELVSGEATVCFAMSEPDAGSDAWAMSTRAVACEGGWKINGVKQWISNGASAKYAFVFAVTNQELRAQRHGGITCFLVPTDSSGFDVSSSIRLFGHAGGDETILSCSDVVVPSTHVVGEVDKGFDLAICGISQGRLYNIARCIGMGRWAVNKTREYVAQRIAFGQPVGEYQGISFPLADSAVELYAALSMGLDCAARLQRGENASSQLAMAKIFATEMCCRVFDRCMQAHGGMGLTNELRLYDGWEQARSVRIADGSSEILRRNVARALLRGSLEP